MPNVLSTLKPLSVRLVTRLPRIIRRNRHALAAPAPATVPTAFKVVGVPTTSSSSMSESDMTALAGAGIKDLFPAKGFDLGPDDCGASGGIAKDVLMTSLDALAQSADAFPPLKSAVCGLLFLTAQVEMVSSNKAQITNIYSQIDEFAASLERAIPDATELSSAHEAAIRALAADISAVVAEMKAMAKHGKIVRFFRAKREAASLGQLVKRLEQADKSFTITMLSSVEIKVSEIHGTVLPLRDEVHRLTRIGKYFFLTTFSSWRSIAQFMAVLV